MKSKVVMTIEDYNALHNQMQNDKAAYKHQWNKSAQLFLQVIGLQKDLTDLKMKVVEYHLTWMNGKLLPLESEDYDSLLECGITKEEADNAYKKLKESKGK